MKGFEKAKLIENLMREKAVVDKESELQKTYDMYKAEHEMHRGRMHTLENEMVELQRKLNVVTSFNEEDQRYLDSLAIELFKTDFHKVTYADFSMKSYLKEHLLLRNVMDVFTYPHCNIHEVVCRPYFEKDSDDARLEKLKTHGFHIIYETPTRYLMLRATEFDDDGGSSK